MNFLWSVTLVMVFYDLHGTHGISMEYHQIHHVGFMGHVCMALYPIWMVTTHETLKLRWLHQMIRDVCQSRPKCCIDRGSKIIFHVH